MLCSYFNGYEQTYQQTVNNLEFIFLPFPSTCEHVPPQLLTFPHPQKKKNTYLIRLVYLL
jgi:hypothetical protein